MMVLMLFYDKALKQLDTTDHENTNQNVRRAHLEGDPISCDIQTAQDNLQLEQQ